MFAPFLLFIHATCVAGGADKPTVLISISTEADTPADSADVASRLPALYQQLTSLARQYFTCATITSRQEIADMFAADHARVQKGGASQLDEIASTMASRYTILFTFRKVSGGSYSLSGTGFDMKTSNALEGKQELGTSGDISGMAKRIMERVALTEICPWLGTITIKRTISKNKNYTYPSNRDDISYDTKVTSSTVESETWEVEKVGRTRGKGTVTYTGASSKTEEYSVSGKVPCWRSPDNGCSIVDERIPGTFEHFILKTSNSSSGSRNFENAAIVITVDPMQGRYFIAINHDPLWIAGGEASEYEMKENSCSKCVIKDVKGVGYGVVAANWLVGDVYKLGATTLSGNTSIPDDVSKILVSWSLHR